MPRAPVIRIPVGTLLRSSYTAVKRDSCPPCSLVPLVPLVPLDAKRDKRDKKVKKDKRDKRDNFFILLSLFCVLKCR